ncbi:hypothetical protein H0E87_009563 [Populus deltoides]|uniref:Uncharacterized protein n=1 Tax=Populus deltoides TaxID=3696 RepID=A0A8T2YPG3_POPDE|nr:hypothetical protein H0E87_009563 [Populus deltoides]
MDELSSHSSSAISTPKNDSSVSYPAHSDAMKSSHLIGVSDSLSSAICMYVRLLAWTSPTYPAKVAAANETGIRKANLKECFVVLDPLLSFGLIIPVAEVRIH